MTVGLSIRVAVAAAALLATTTGCASDGQESASGPAAPTQVPTPAAAPAAPTAAPEPPAEGPAPSAGGTSVPLLEGTVGTEEDPESFELTLTDSSGAPVETLPAGDYDIRVRDAATLHNFHLTGPGVDETTPISGTDEVVWRVSFTAGEYTAVCDPHPDMAASFTVS